MLPKGAYDPLTEEIEILKYWLDKNFYKPEYDPKEDKVVDTGNMKSDLRHPFCIINPPPNAYARPHIGNVSGYAYQDLFARFARMNGKKVVMVPGKDHAGQEGEAVFIKTELLPKGKKRNDFTREEFFKLCYEHNVKNMADALADEKRVGLSSDFDRNLFTLDPRAVGIVMETFVQMYKDEMIYKGVRIINWSPGMQSAISDNDTSRVSREVNLTYIKYPIIPDGVRIWYLNFRDHEIFKQVVEGKKSIETRALNPEEPEKYFGDIKEGDWIVCVDKTDHNQSCLLQAKRVAVYKAEKPNVGTSQSLPHPGINPLAEIFENENIKKIFPSKEIRGLQELEMEYKNLWGGLLDKISENGIVAIDLESITNNQSPITYIEVATTRSETMLGDTAVVVDPSDDRYKDLIGKNCLLPLVNRKIPIIANGKVDKEFGTGAAKMTPAHAQEDYYMAEEWNILDEQLKRKPDKEGRVLTDAIGYVTETQNFASPQNFVSPQPVKYWQKIRQQTGAVPYINVIGKDLKMCGPVGKYFGLTIEECRAAVETDLKSASLITKVEKIEQNVTICDRTKTVVEPMMSSQWFVDVNKKDFRQNAIRAIENGLKPETENDENAVRIHPDNMAHKALHWLNNLRDWPISRSIWWGYRIPVWYKGSVDEYVDDNGQVRQTIDGVEFESLKEALEKGLVHVGEVSPGATLLGILRHGEAEHNLTGGFGGARTDTNLTENGFKMALDFAREMKDQYDLILTSPLKRALETAKIISNKHNIPLIINDILTERDFGELEGLTWSEFEEKYPDLAKENNEIYQPYLPAGESIEDVEKRVDQLIDDVSKRYPGRKILVVTHAGIIRILKRKLNKASYEQSRVDIKNLEVIKAYINPKNERKNAEIYLVPGKHGFAFRSLYPRLEKEFPNALEVKVENIKKPTYEDYRAVFNKIKFSPSDTVVAHSIGSQAMLDYIIDEKINIDRLILLAPSTKASQNYRKWLGSGFWKNKDSYGEIRKYVNKLTIIHSDNDEHASTKAFNELASFINATEILLEKGKRHFAGEDYNYDSEKLIELLVQSPSTAWSQDPDCLDTWFSSGQWPFVTLKVHGIDDVFYPTDIMETAYDILEPWVCRMIMFGLYKEGRVPFRDVYLHGLIRAEDGQKMSKSKGNVVYTDEIILKYGADNIRLFYISGNKAGAGYRVDWEKIEGNKRFLNKLWNASRFVLMNLTGVGIGSDLPLPNPRLDDTKWESEKMYLTTSLSQESNQNLYAHTADLYRETTRRIDNFNVGVALQELTNEFWHTFCDIHLERAKMHIYPQKDLKTKEVISEPSEEEKKETQRVLQLALKAYLKMLHPFIPFITERIWKEMPKEEGDHESLMYTGW